MVENEDNASFFHGNLEMVHWNDKESYNYLVREGTKVDKSISSFADVSDAILANGPILISNDRVNLWFKVLSGKFEDEIIVIRQSGLNIRRFLVREVFFEDSFGDFSGCIDHHLSNNAVDCEIEVKHIIDVANDMGLDADAIEKDKHYSRLEIDLVAALQLLQIKEVMCESDRDLKFLFALGFSVGRLFSSSQNLATLEDNARVGIASIKAQTARGVASGRSAARKRIKRIEGMLSQMEHLVANNPILTHKTMRHSLACLAIENAIKNTPKLWSQGKDQCDNYLSAMQTDKPFKERFAALGLQ